jgi:hypothetical protein
MGLASRARRYRDMDRRLPGRGQKEGRGVAQWFEHRHPIDRFEGICRRGKRQGFGRYD